MGRAQGELRGPRVGGGDWDQHASDAVGPAFIEVNPGEQCAERIAAYADGRTARCANRAPVGLSICTPCHRARIRARFRRLSREHRQRIADARGVALNEIQ